MARAQQVETILEIVKVGKTKTPYLTIKGLPIETCVVCQETQETNSHHLIPKRCYAKNRILGNLRISACENCHKKLHPENGEIDGFEIIKKQAKKIDKMKIAFKALMVKDYQWLIDEINIREKYLIDNIKKQTETLKEQNNLKQIHPMQCKMEGHLKELNTIRHTIQHKVHSMKIKKY